MALTHEDMQEIKKILDDRYVQIVDCDNKQTDINTKYAKVVKRLDRIELLQEEGNKKIDKNNWLTTTILGIIIAGVIGYIFLNFGG